MITMDVGPMLDVRKLREASTTDIMELARVYDKLTVKDCFTKDNLNAYLQMVEDQCFYTTDIKGKGT